MDKFEKITIRMSLYGIILGGLAGGLAFLTINIIFDFENQYDITLGLICYSLVLGGFLGALLGGISGFSSGFIMTIVSAVFFREPPISTLYKVSMGLITLIVTSYILFDMWDFWQTLIGLSADLNSLWTSALGMSVVIAVYASQITARKYIKEISVRKGKAKA